MAAVVTLLVILLLSLLLTRIATIALTLTGLSREAARFQARSALTGTGFTTREAEQVVTHPVRRRIVLLLMLAGSAGFVTAVATLLLSFTGAGTAGAGLRRAVALVAGLLILVFLARGRWADRWLSPLIERLLRRFTNLHSLDHLPLLRLSDDWLVAQLEVSGDDWLAGRTLAELDLPHEGVLVLGIERRDGYVGAPKGSERIERGDVLILYGRSAIIDRIDSRPRGPAGERDRRVAEEVYRRLLAEQEAEPAEAPRERDTA